MLLSQEKKKARLAEIIKENQTALYRMAYSHVRNEDLAKEIVQETILAAFSKLRTLKEENYMKTWLMRICINKALDALRQRKKITEDTVELQDYQAAYEETSAIEYSDLFHAIMKLDDKIKTVIILRYFEEMKFDEIARATRTNVNTVKSQVYKGLELLKEELEKEAMA